MHIRTLFVAEPAQADEVHRLIDEALRGGGLSRPNGVMTHWELLTSEAADVSAEEGSRPAAAAELMHAWHSELILIPS